jgi:hypothetical protein
MLQSGVVSVTMYMKVVLMLSGDVSVILVVQGDQKVSVHLMITKQKVTSNVQIVPRQSPDIY